VNTAQSSLAFANPQYGLEKMLILEEAGDPRTRPNKLMKHFILHRAFQ
jgi:hypothetical protein